MATPDPYPGSIPAAAAISAHYGLDPSGAWCVEVLALDGTWLPMQRSDLPYRFTSEQHALYMARICYPDAMREARLGGRVTVRVRQVEQQHQAVEP